MTHRAYQRLRKWELKTRNAYDQGVIEGMDAFYLGHDTPPDYHPTDFNLEFFWRTRQRLDQYVHNVWVARCMGRHDGWTQAAEVVRQSEEDDWIEEQVERGVAQINNYLRDNQRGKEAA